MGYGRFVRYLVLAFALGAVPLAIVAWLAFGSDSKVARWRHAATDADRPRIWFDGTVGELEGGETCLVRQEIYRKEWHVEHSFSRPWIPVVERGTGRERKVELSLLEVVVTREPTDEELAAALGGKPQSENARYRVVCASSHDRVWIDGCFDPAGEVILRCSGAETSGSLRPPVGLAGERASEIVARANAIWAVGMIFIVLASLLGPTVWRAGHRIRPLLRDTRHQPLSAMLAFVLTAPFALTVERLGVFHRVRDYIEAPPKGTLLLEGVVGPETPRGASVISRRPVALSIVAVARILRGKGERFIPIGEVQDVGRLEIATETEVVRVELDDAVFELETDETVECEGSKVSREVRAELAIQSANDYRLSEACLDRGDPICVWVEGELPKKERSESVGSVYRSPTLREGVRIAARARPGVFEGTREVVLERLSGKARAVEKMAATVGALALLAGVWAIVVALVARQG